VSELAIERHFGDDYPELLREIATEVFLQLSEREATKALGEDEIARIGFLVAEHVRQVLGGTTFYLPRGEQYERSTRDQEIFNKFRGDYRVLAQEYKMSEMRIRQIVDRCRRAEQKRRQGDLFAAKMAVAGK